MNLWQRLASAVVFLSLYVITNAANEPPFIEPISNVTIQESDTITIPIRVSDPDTELAHLVFRGSTLRTNLVASLTFGLNRGMVEAKIQTKPRAFGFATITIQVSDEENVAIQSFALTVLERQRWVLIAPIADQRTIEDTPLLVPFNVFLEYVETNDLVIFAAAANTNLISSIEIRPEDSRYIAQIVPRTNAFGSTRITISGSDGNSVSRQSFNLEVLPVLDLPHLSIQRGDNYSLAIDSGDPLELYAIEKTHDFTTWELLSTVRLDGDGRAQAELGRREPASFVRLRKQ